MSKRNTVYFPKAEGPLYYYKATIATYDIDWWLAKGAIQDQEEAIEKGKALADKPKPKERKTYGKVKPR